MTVSDIEGWVDILFKKCDALPRELLEK